MEAATHDQGRFLRRVRQAASEARVSSGSLWVSIALWTNSLYRRTFVRIAPNEVSILALDAVQQVYGHGSRFKKSAV